MKVMPSPTPSSVSTWLAVNSPTTSWRSSPSVATLSPPPPSARSFVTSRRSSAMSPSTSSRRCPPPPPPPPSRSPTSFPTDRSSPSETSVSVAPRLSSSLPSSEWRPAASTRPPTTPSCSATLISGRTCTPTPSCPEAPPCTPVSPTGCRRRSPPWLPPPSRSRSLLLPRGSTPSGLEDPSWLPSPPSSRCGSPSRSTTSAAHPLSTASASKCFSWENLKKYFSNRSSPSPYVEGSTCGLGLDLLLKYFLRFSHEKHLEALAVDDGWAALVVLLLGDPHLLEGGERGEDGASDPDGVLPLGGSDDLDLDGGGSKGGDLLLHPVSNTRVHGGASGHDGVGVQVLPDVNIALHDGVVGGLVDATGLPSEERRLEESLGAPEPLVANGDDLAVRKLVGLLKGGGGSSSGHLLLEIKSNIAELLLDVTDNLSLGSGGEGVATLSQDLHEVVGQLTASKVKTNNGVGEGITFIDGDSVGDTITRVHDDTSGTARGVQGEDGLDGDIHGRGVEGLEHGLVPDLLHIVPVGDDSVFYRVLEGEDTPLGLSLVTHIGVLLSHAHHDSLVPGAANNGGEDSPGGVISSEASLTHAGAIVNNQGSNVLVTHLAVLKVLSR